MKKQYFLIVITLFITVGLIVTVIVFSPDKEGFDNRGSSITSEVKEIVRSGIDSVRTKVRKPAVAGDFYPKEPAMLNRQLENYLEQAETLPVEGKVRVLIVPHAGTKFSGQTAAKGFKQIDGEKYSKIIVLGVSHKSPISHAAVYSEGLWETPFGNIEIDEELANKIISKKYNVVADDAPHKDEHALEVPILFLEKVLKDYKIVPILLGRPDDALVDYLAYKIAGIMDDETLLMISTDLSHYPNWQDANYADRNTINAILTGKVQALDNMINFNTEERYPGLSTSACGYHALRVALKLSEILDINRIKEIDYTNSGDISGDKGKVVGYAAIGMWSEKLPPIILKQEAKEEALKLARDTLENHYEKNQASYTPVNPDLQHQIGAFVTLTKDGNLRGCVGHFEPEDPLYKVIQNVSVSSAVKDTRFTPITREELDEIKIEISTMSPQRYIKNWEDVEIGKHGVRIVQKGRTGTLLPQVATDNNWDLITFLETICWQKMGLDKGCYKEPASQIYVYETDIFAEEG